MIKVCPICKVQYGDGNYCPSCGLPWGGFRHEFMPVNDYQLCPSCETPNHFGVNFCKNCGESIKFHAKDRNKHGWIDLGLTVLWATENMQGFYPWMDSETKLGLYSKPDVDSRNDKKDVATAQWGYKWRIPTKEEFQELIDKCRWETIVLPTSNKHALKATGPNGNFIILPVTGHAGCCKRTIGFFETGKDIYWECSLWTSTKDSDRTAYRFFYYSPKHSEYEEMETDKQIAEESLKSESFFNLRSVFFDGASMNEIMQREREQQKRIDAMGSDWEERKINDKLNEKNRNKLWLESPLDIRGFNLILLHPCVTSHGHAIRPVADKIWQGQI